MFLCFIKSLESFQSPRNQPPELAVPQLGSKLSCQTTYKVGRVQTERKALQPLPNPEHSLRNKPTKIDFVSSNTSSVVVKCKLVILKILNLDKCKPM